jgi:hypothetical protein
LYNFYIKSHKIPLISFRYYDVQWRVIMHDYYNRLFFISIVVLTACPLITGCSKGMPSYWHANGTMVKDMVWELPLADSSVILKTENGIWTLPQPPDTVIPQISYTTYRTPRYSARPGIPGRIDQEVVHSSDTINTEFYRFENGNVLLLGFASADTSKPPTLFDPPLIIMPANLGKAEKSFTSSGIMKIRSGNKPDSEYRSTYSVVKKGTGRLAAEDGKEIKAVFCENTFSRDMTMHYGRTELIMPDAMTIKSFSVLSEEEGTLLEWGIRSRKTKTGSGNISGTNTELFIEITMHKIQ